MSSPLQPGIKAPNFVLPAANLEGDVSLDGHQGQNVVLVFFPSSMEEVLVEQLAKFQGELADLEAQAATAIGISDASLDDLQRLSTERDIAYPIVTDSNPPALFINGIPLDGPRTQEAIRARIEALLGFKFKGNG